MISIVAEIAAITSAIPSCEILPFSALSVDPQHCKIASKIETRIPTRISPYFGALCLSDMNGKLSNQARHPSLNFNMP